MEKTRQSIPAARRTELVIQESEGETLVYDLKSHKAHCLNRTSALVWKHCDREQSLEEVAGKVGAELGAKVSPELVRLAVDQLEKAGLLQERVKRYASERRMSRREVMIKVGVSAAAALPFIKSINAPAALQAASCGDIEAFCGGAGDPPCCPTLVCCGGSCLPGC